MRETDLEEVIDRVAELPPGEEGHRALEGLLRSLGSRTPIVLGQKALFLYEGKGESSVSVAGDFNSWDPSSSPMRKAPGSGVFWLAIDLPPDARIEYKLVAEGQWLLDPLNLESVTGKFGTNSVLAMPKYEGTADYAELSGFDSVVRRLSLRSKTLGSVWEVNLRVPRTAVAQGLLVVLGGRDYLEYGGAERVIDLVMSSGRVKPFASAFVDPHDPSTEYEMVKSCGEFVAKELIPFIEAETELPARRGEIAVLGAARGGLISLLSALKFPEVVGKGAAQSGYFTGIWHATVMELISSFGGASRLYLDCGTFETNVSGQGSILHATRDIAAALRSRGCDVMYLETKEGHNWSAWRNRLPRALEFLYGARSDGA